MAAGSAGFSYTFCIHGRRFRWGRRRPRYRRSRPAVAGEGVPHQAPSAPRCPAVGTPPLMTTAVVVSRSRTPCGRHGLWPILCQAGWRSTSPDGVKGLVALGPPRDDPAGRPWHRHQGALGQVGRRTEPPAVISDRRFRRVPVEPRFGPGGRCKRHFTASAYISRRSWTGRPGGGETPTTLRSCAPSSPSAKPSTYAVVAEGVESQAQAEPLLSLGCHDARAVTSTARSPATTSAAMMNTTQP